MGLPLFAIVPTQMKILRTVNGNQVVTPELMVQNFDVSQKSPKII